MPYLSASNRIAAPLPGKCSLEKPLDPCEAEYSVTGTTRREAWGSTCRALLEGIVGNKHEHWQTGIYSKWQDRVILGQAYVCDQSQNKTNLT